MSVYRCDWCGRFYSSQLPDGSACPSHIEEHNERQRASIERHNATLTRWMAQSSVSPISRDEALRRLAMPDGTDTMDAKTGFHPLCGEEA